MCRRAPNTRRGTFQETGCTRTTWSQYLLAGVFCELCMDGPYTGTMEEKAKQLWQDVQQLYADRHTSNRLSALLLKMFYQGPSSFATLKTKAAETASLVDVVYELCLRVGGDTERDQVRLIALDGMAAMNS